MVICLKSKVNNNYHNINDIMYVVIHEISHIACPEIGHTPLFSKINIYFLKKSMECGIYNYQDYNIKPIEYCGIKISNNII